MLFKNLRLLLLCAIATTIAPAVHASADSVKGTLTIGGKVIELKKVYALYVEDPDSDGKQVLMLRLSDVELTSTRKSDLREQAEAGKLNFVEFIFNPDNKITTVLILSKLFDNAEFYTFKEEGVPQSITNEAGTIKGTVAWKETADNPWELKADFEVVPAAE